MHSALGTTGRSLMKSRSAVTLNVAGLSGNGLRDRGSGAEDRSPKFMAGLRRSAWEDRKDRSPKSGGGSLGGGCGSSADTAESMSRPTSANSPLFSPGQTPKSTRNRRVTDLSFADPFSAAMAGTVSVPIEPRRASLGSGPPRAALGSLNRDALTPPSSPSASVPLDQARSSLLLRRAACQRVLPLSINKPEALRKIRQLAEDEKIYDLYWWDTVLQESGGGGKVVVCRAKEPNSPVSAKAFDAEFSGKDDDRFNYVMKIKAKADLERFGVEKEFRKMHLKMLNLPPHKGVLPLHEVLEDDFFYYVVMLKANGGSLLESLLDEYSDGNMPEKALRNLLREILGAVAYLHAQGILHRDIKPDNVVVQINDEPASPNGKVRAVRLIDFDLADPDWSPASPGKLANFVGTMRSSAPETFRGVFSQRSDLYSVGAILYLLMTGHLPYPERIFEQRFDRIYDLLRDECIDWSDDCWKERPHSWDFCQRLLAFDPLERPAAADEALEHPWFKQAFERPAVNN